MPTDNATPAGNSVSVSNLLYLAQALDRAEFRQRAERCLRTAAPIWEENPTAVARLAVAASEWLALPEKERLRAKLPAAKAAAPPPDRPDPPEANP
jgi:uncharacterized protein YyaL (SSP411 family)